MRLFWPCSRESCPDQTLPIVGVVGSLHWWFAFWKLTKKYDKICCLATLFTSCAYIFFQLQVCCIIMCRTSCVSRASEISWLPLPSLSSQAPWLVFQLLGFSFACHFVCVIIVIVTNCLFVLNLPVSYSRLLRSSPRLISLAMSSTRQPIFKAQFEKFVAIFVSKLLPKCCADNMQIVMLWKLIMSKLSKRNVPGLMAN